MKRNWIICLLAVVLAAGAFVATNSAAALALAGVSVLAPVASILFGRATAARTDIAIDFQRSCTAGQQLDMAITDIMAQTTQANRSSISGTTYDYHRKGQDRTEVFDLREFAEGDSLKSVHWKLSARFGDLMVREPSRPTDYDITLLCDGHAISANAGSAAVLNGVLAVTASVSLSLIQQEFSHSVAYAADGNLESRFVDSRTSFNTMLDVLVGTPAPTGHASDIAAFEEFRRMHNVTRTVLVTDAMNEDLTAQLSRITDLSVLHISEGAQAGIDRSGGYTLTHIPVETIGERIKNLEL